MGKVQNHYLPERHWFSMRTHNLEKSLPSLWYPGAIEGLESVLIRYDKWAIEGIWHMAVSQNEGNPI